ncbi:DUF6283 family protein [Amycolatopsis sp. NPDC088138]|uniref:DUF6283 family protein n=1 Tax=Amycolatopsis sp. NPDC088138 TaxID=3363938 RepID=UPI0037F74E39
MVPEPHRTHPCAQCPWRQDADLTAFSDADMTKLANANGFAGCEAPADAPAMSCHLDQPDSAHPMRLCAGWLAVVGRHHLGIRMALMIDKLPPAAVDTNDDWPPLHESLDDLTAERTRQQLNAPPTASLSPADPPGGR